MIHQKKIYNKEIKDQIKDIRSRKIKQSLAAKSIAANIVIDQN
jgi:hypothetical protein